MSFLLLDNNLAFSIALSLMLIIGLMEGVLVVLGIGLSQAIDSMLPDLNIDAETGFVHGDGALSNFLGWIRVGQVPALVILIVFLCSFSLTGLAIQLALESIFGFTLPALIASFIVFFITLPFIRGINGVLSKIVFKDETESISSDSFIGRVAVITLGESRQGSPAEARFKDQHGTTHYVMVEPMENNSFRQGDKVLLVESLGSIFKVIEPLNSNLND